MTLSLRQRPTAAVAVALAALAAAAGAAALPGAAPAGQISFTKVLERNVPGGDPLDHGGGEAFEAKTAAEQFAEARLAPGQVGPGAYSTAYAQLTALTPTGGSWQELTNRRYQSDSPYFRDYYSNSSSGSGLVTGRITGLAADDAGHVYAAGADGGVWRSSTGGGSWTPIADALPTLSSGTVELQGGTLWYATGEANTGGTSYVGTGVYALPNPTTGAFAVGNRVGRNELESTTINALRFSGTTVYAATNRGVWSHSTDPATFGTRWHFEYAPNMSWLPAFTDDTASYPDGTDYAAAKDKGANLGGYKNIVNDLAVDPSNAGHVIANIAWRGGDTYNGFYERSAATGRWAKIAPTGAINPKDIGNTTFAFAADGKSLYATVESVTLYNRAYGTQAANTVLDGVYLSRTGLAGPWSLIADSRKLANSGSALKQSVGGKGYGPGVQAWYNQFLLVDPANAKHVYVGLEEVYETRDAGATWKTVGPYWNFYFDCWGTQYRTETAGCNPTTHSDQHSAAIGVVGGKAMLFVGNDGGVYSRPVAGHVDGAGHATDWKSLNDGTIDALQYYAVGVGNNVGTLAQQPDAADVAWPTTGKLVSGGLQDNGGSLLSIDGGASPDMVSNFGGDGGDVAVNPADGCQIVQEYVYLSMRLTKGCAQRSDLDSYFYTAKAGTISIKPLDTNARFIAPFATDQAGSSWWIAGGQNIWVQNKGWGITKGGDWTSALDLGYPKVVTAVSMRGDKAIATWCGPCGESGFQRGVAIGTLSNGKWTFARPEATGLPNRYLGGVDVGTDNAFYVAAGGFSRKFTEGPGAGTGHVFRSTDGTTWADLGGPDVPASSIKQVDNQLVVGTDLGVIVKDVTGWHRLGSGLPLTTVMDVEVHDGKVYAATHGRGLWRLPL